MRDDGTKITCSNGKFQAVKGRKGKAENDEEGEPVDSETQSVQIYKAETNIFIQAANGTARDTALATWSLISTDGGLNSGEETANFLMFSEFKIARPC